MKKSKNTYNRIALCESWAEHIGMTFADKTYGNNTWFNPSPISYNNRLEHIKNEVTDHIPIGLYHDLIDGTNINEQAGDGTWGNISIGTINDNVSGLTNSQLFTLLDANTNSPAIFIQRVNNSGIIQFPNTTSSVNNLFMSY